MKKKPLPQFSSLNESREYYSQYGKLTYWGRLGIRCDEYLYGLDVIDGRHMTLKMYEDGRVEAIFE